MLPECPKRPLNTELELVPTGWDLLLNSTCTASPIAKKSAKQEQTAKPVAPSFAPTTPPPKRIDSRKGRSIALVNQSPIRSPLYLPLIAPIAEDAMCTPPLQVDQPTLDVSPTIDISRKIAPTLLDPSSPSSPTSLDLYFQSLLSSPQSPESDNFYSTHHSRTIEAPMSSEYDHSYYSPYPYTHSPLLANPGTPATKSSSPLHLPCR